MQSTGQTSTHCGVSKWPTHSVHFAGIDHVDLRPLRDRVVRALGLADVAVDAFVGDHQRHRARLLASAALARPCAFSRASTAGCTNDETSPPNFAISRTIVAEMNMYCSDGVRNSVSTSGIEVPVHARHLELVLEVGHGAQAAQDDARALLVDEIHQQRRRSRRPRRSDSGASTSRAIATRSAVGEERALRLAVGDADDDPVEQPRRAAHEVLVAAGERDRTCRGRRLSAWRAACRRRRGTRSGRRGIRADEKMIMHLPRLVAAPRRESRRRRERVRRLGVDEAARREPRGAGRQQPRPRIVANGGSRKITSKSRRSRGEERARVGDVRLERRARRAPRRSRAARRPAPRLRSTATASAAPRDSASSDSAPDAGVEIEAALARSGPAQPVEQRLADAVRRRAQARGRRESGSRGRARRRR